MARGRWLALAVAAVVVGAAAIAAVQRYQRSQEWAHGGDAVTMRVQSRVADAQTLPAVADALGYPDSVVLPSGCVQAVVVRLEWHGPAPRGGRYNLIALDGRARPPRPLRFSGGWAAGGGTGGGWSGAYETLADHYDWLAGTASTRSGSGWTSTATAAGASASGSGSITGIFLACEQTLPFTDTADLLVAVFLVDGHGEVRWARRIDAPSA